MLNTKSVSTDIDRTVDGLRILATRFRGRGLAASRYDVWMPALGPSEDLLNAMRSGTVSWAEFGRRYRAELLLDGDIDKRNRTILNHGQKSTLRLIKHLAASGNVTLMCHCAEDEPHCHRHLLRALIASRRV